MALEQELETYKQTLASLRDHEGKCVLIHGEEIREVFTAYEDAIKEGYKQCGLAPFLVKRIEADEKAHFISRLIAPQCLTSA